MYVGLWSRLEDFERASLTQALEQRKVIQATLMRITIHLVSAGDYWPMAMATASARQQAWLRYHRGGTEREMAASARLLRTKLADGPLRQKEIQELLGDRAVANGVGQWVQMVRVPPSGTWERRRADLFGDAEEWVGPPKVGPDDALDLLVRRYLSGFGPAPRRDIADWAGLPVTAIDPALGRLRLRRFRDEDGNELLDLPRMPLPAADAPAPVRFLPVWDATLLVHARRTGILPEEHRPKVFNVKTPHSVNTFLVDGEVAGTWRYEKGRVRLEPFGRLDRSARLELDAEAEGLAALHA